MRGTSILILSGLAVLIVCGAVGGPGLSGDASMVRGFVGWRAQHPELTGGLVWLTQLGGSGVLLPLALLGAGWLVWRRRPWDGIWLIGTLLAGRALVELLKWATDRPRPGFDAHPVSVASQSYPSGHAGNSMITYLGLALFALPEKWRPAGVTAAVLLSLLVGASRPMLGVHWPTDVLGGWALGAAWTLACWTAAQRFKRA